MSKSMKQQQDRLRKQQALRARMGAGTKQCHYRSSPPQSNTQAPALDFTAFPEWACAQRGAVDVLGGSAVSAALNMPGIITSIQGRERQQYMASIDCTMYTPVNIGEAMLRHHEGEQAGYVDIAPSLRTLDGISTPVYVSRDVLDLCVGRAESRHQGGLLCDLIDVYRVNRTGGKTSFVWLEEGGRLYATSLTFTTVAGINAKVLTLSSRHRVVEGREGVVSLNRLAILARSCGCPSCVYGRRVGLI